MKAKREAGVMQLEPMYFASSDLFTKKNLLYALWGSTYLLDKPYEVKRSYMNAFMIQYIISGELHLEIEGEQITAKSGGLVLIDCKKPHRYWVQSRCEVKWFHFNGVPAQPLADYIFAYNKTGCFDAFSAKKAVSQVDNVMELLRMKGSSWQIAEALYRMMCRLAALPSLQKSSAEELVEKAVQYMGEHFSRTMTVQEVAAHTGLSLFYFTRLFKRLMQVSPHAYLNRLRMEKAKNLLVYTYYSIEEIAEMTGFQSASHFIRAFKQSADITPKKFRESAKGGEKL